MNMSPMTPAGAGRVRPALARFVAARPDSVALLTWLSLVVTVGYQRIYLEWCSQPGGGWLPNSSPLLRSLRCDQPSWEQLARVLSSPVQVYTDLLWQSGPRAPRWVQGQIVGVAIRLLAVLLLPPAAYRTVSPWLIAASRVVAPACLVLVSWRGLAAPAGGAGAGAAVAAAAAGAAARAAVGEYDHYVDFSLRWYPLMDIALGLIHPTSMPAEVVYALLSLGCMALLAVRPPGLGLAPPPGFFAPLQLAKCAASSGLLLALEAWRRRLARGSSGGRGGGVISGRGGSGATGVGPRISCSGSGLGTDAAAAAAARVSGANRDAILRSGGGKRASAGQERMIAGQGSMSCKGAAGCEAWEWECGWEADPKAAARSALPTPPEAPNEAMQQAPPPSPAPAPAPATRPAASMLEAAELARLPAASSFSCLRRQDSTCSGGRQSSGSSSSSACTSADARRRSSSDSTGDAQETVASAEAVAEAVAVDAADVAADPAAGGWQHDVDSAGSAAWVDNAAAPAPMAAAVEAAVALEAPEDGAAPVAEGVQQAWRNLHYAHVYRLGGCCAGDRKAEGAAGAVPGEGRAAAEQAELSRLLHSGAAAGGSLQMPVVPAAAARRSNYQRLLRAAREHQLAAQQQAGADDASPEARHLDNEVGTAAWLPVTVSPSAAGAAAKPPHVQYRVRTHLYSARVKLGGCDPRQLPSGYQQRLAAAVGGWGLVLENVTVRRGCIELVVDARGMRLREEREDRKEREEGGGGAAATLAAATAATNAKAAAGGAGRLAGLGADAAGETFEALMRSAGVRLPGSPAAGSAPAGPISSGPLGGAMVAAGSRLADLAAGFVRDSALVMPADSSMSVFGAHSLGGGDGIGGGIGMGISGAAAATTTAAAAPHSPLGPPLRCQPVAGSGSGSGAAGSSGGGRCGVVDGVGVVFDVVDVGALIRALKVPVHASELDFNIAPGSHIVTSSPMRGGGTAASFAAAPAASLEMGPGYGFRPDAGGAGAHGSDMEAGDAGWWQESAYGGYGGYAASSLLLPSAVVVGVAAGPHAAVLRPLSPPPPSSPLQLLAAGRHMAEEYLVIPYEEDEREAGVGMEAAEAAAAAAHAEEHWHEMAGGNCADYVEAAWTSSAEVAQQARPLPPSSPPVPPSHPAPHPQPSPAHPGLQLPPELREQLLYLHEQQRQRQQRHGPAAGPLGAGALAAGGGGGVRGGVRDELRRLQQSSAATAAAALGQMRVIDVATAATAVPPAAAPAPAAGVSAPAAPAAAAAAAEPLRAAAVRIPATAEGRPARVLPPSLMLGIGGGTAAAAAAAAAAAPAGPAGAAAATPALPLTTEPQRHPRDARLPADATRPAVVTPSAGLAPGVAPAAAAAAAQGAGGVTPQVLDVYPRVLLVGGASSPSPPRAAAAAAAPPAPPVAPARSPAVSLTLVVAWVPSHGGEAQQQQQQQQRQQRSPPGGGVQSGSNALAPQLLPAAHVLLRSQRDFLAVAHITPASTPLAGGGAIAAAIAATGAAAVPPPTPYQAALEREVLYNVDLGSVPCGLRPGSLLVEVKLTAAAEPGAGGEGGVSSCGLPPPLSVVPVLLVDDADVAAEVQAAIDGWAGSPDELDGLLHDLGGLLSLQEELVDRAARAHAAAQVGSFSSATAAAAAAAAAAAGAAAGPAGGSGGGAARQQAAVAGVGPVGAAGPAAPQLVDTAVLSARAATLHCHLCAYAQAVGWSRLRAWLEARRAALVALAAATAGLHPPAPAAPAPLAPVPGPASEPEPATAAGTAVTAAAAAAPVEALVDSNAAARDAGLEAPLKVATWAVAHGPLSTDEATGRTDEREQSPALLPPLPGAFHNSSAAQKPVEGFTTKSEPAAPPPAQAPAAVTSCGDAASTHWQRLQWRWAQLCALWRRLAVLLAAAALQQPVPGDSLETAAAHRVYATSFATNMMNVMQVFELVGGGACLVSSGGWADSDKACVVAGAAVGLALGAAWLVTPREQWRRWSAASKWPRQAGYTVAKFMVAFLGFPQPPNTVRHELSFSIFLVEGVILPAAVLMTPAESVLVGLVRAPLCARMWWLNSTASAGAAAVGAAAGGSCSLTWLVLRALCLAATATCSTLAVHVFIRLSFERNRSALQRRAPPGSGVAGAATVGAPPGSVSGAGGNSVAEASAESTAAAAAAAAEFMLSGPGGKAAVHKPKQE